ncbi:hypothetical protein EVAR_44124_1 [Eumeta japonica]|uniref:Uncharacterized protein n=1 Tax=Eumeta variegata TaxID=151549 RepID=A0A4C1XJT7_EUMVA|nr:hypothetical protein EVAR_44124_1 [Eumeta japonica]
MTLQVVGGCNLPAARAPLPVRAGALSSETGARRQYCRATATSSSVFGSFNLVSGDGLDRIYLFSSDRETLKRYSGKIMGKKKEHTAGDAAWSRSLRRALFLSPFWSNVLITDLINIPKLRMGAAVESETETEAEVKTRSGLKLRMNAGLE